MLNFKRMGRLAACLLVVCVLVSSLPRPAAALPAEGVILPDTQTEAADHTASLVRYSASYSATVIGCLENGTKVTVLSSTNEFYRIDCYDMNGYIARSQVTQSEDGTYYVNCVEGSSETKVFDTYTAQDALNMKAEIRSFSTQYVGVPYVAGGTTPRGFDCSGFTQYVFNNLDFNIHRTVAAQLQDGVIIAKEDLQCGDLIFFQNTTGYGHFASHVGIYIGNGQMIHAGGRGIAIVSLEEAYYTYHYMCARRVVLSDLSSETVIPAVGINQNMNSSYWRESSQTEEGLGSFLSETLAIV